MSSKRFRQARQVLLVFGLALLLGLGAFALYAWEREIDPVVIATENFPEDLVQQGAELSAVGNCAVCHTSEDGAPYAGGYTMETPFGTIYSTNITPDPETGIGTWSEAAFARAMREGVNREGQHLYPAFPYHFFARTTDDDMRALYSYLMTIDPVQQAARENDMPFPLGFRPLLAGWKLLFHRDRDFVADPTQDAAWNHGAYLVEGLAHCGACHMPINLLGAPQRREGLRGGETENWIAPALNAANPSPRHWDEESLFIYLTEGRHVAHSAAAGPMRPVVTSLQGARPEDIRAMARHIGSLSPDPAPVTQEAARAYLPRRAVLRDEATAITTPMGQRPTPRGDLLFAGLCASCHVEADPQILDWPRLSHATALYLDGPANLIRVILGGVGSPEDPPDRFMPAFRIDDHELAALLHYLRTDLAGQPGWDDLDTAIADAREEHPSGGTRGAVRGPPTDVDAAAISPGDWTRPGAER